MSTPIKRWQAMAMAVLTIVLAIALAWWRHGVTPADRLACTNLYEAARTLRDSMDVDGTVVHEHSTRAPRSALTSCGDLRRARRL
jgi:hypothetical protein